MHPLLILLAACTAKDSTADSTPAEVDSEVPYDDTATEGVPLTLRFFGDGERLANVAVEIDGEAHVADASAELSLRAMATQTLRVEHQPEGYRRNVFLLDPPLEPLTWELTTSSKEKLSILLEPRVTLDDALGVVVVGVYWGEVGVPYAGTRIELDGHVGPTLLPTPEGFLDANTLTEDSMGLVFFANATPGEAAVRLTTPEPAECGLAPGLGPIPAAPVVEDGYTALVVICGG